MTAIFLFGKVLLANHMEKKSNRKEYVSQATEKMAERRYKKAKA